MPPYFISLSLGLRHVGASTRRPSMERAAEMRARHAIIVQHHYNVPTCRARAAGHRAYHSTRLRGFLMTGHGLPGHGHGIGEAFPAGPVRVA